jgi:hypothetical protein
MSASVQMESYDSYQKNLVASILSKHPNYYELTFRERDNIREEMRKA